jgi:hypothetical protein
MAMAKNFLYGFASILQTTVSIPFRLLAGYGFASLERTYGLQRPFCPTIFPLMDPLETKNRFCT